MNARAALVVFALVPAAGCKPAPMTDFTSAEGRFKVKFPGTPKQTSQVVSGVTVTMYSVESWGAEFMVGVADAPIPPWESASRSRSRLFDARDGALKAIDGKSSGSHTITLHDRYPGVEFGGTGKGKHFRARVYLVGHRVYQVIAAGGSEDFPKSALADEFFNSFELPGEAAAPAKPQAATVPPAKPAPPAPPAAEPSAPAKGVIINSAGGKFKARYPVDPRKVARTVGGTAFTGYAAETAGGAFEVGYADPGGAADESVMDRLEAVLEETVRAANGTVTASKEAALPGGHPGLEFTAAVGDGQLRGRVYWVAGRLYRVTVRGGGEYVGSKEAVAFLESFQVTK